MGVHRVSINIPERVLLAEKTDAVSFARELRMLAAVKLYELGRLSSGRAAELADVPRVEFLLSLERYKVFPLEAGTATWSVLMPAAISNTSPLLYLYRIGVQDWLKQIYGEIWIPGAVVSELKEGQRRGYDVPNPSDYEWLRVVEPSSMPSEWLALDLGAIEVIGHWHDTQDEITDGTSSLDSFSTGARYHRRTS